MDSIDFRETPLPRSDRKLHFKLLVNDKALVEHIEELYSRSNEETPMLGIFVAGFTQSMLPFSVVSDNERLESWRQGASKSLDMLVPPSNAVERQALIVCEECADVGCGQVSARITRLDDTITWDQFAYQMSEDELLDSEILSPLAFHFDWSEYQRALLELSEQVLGEKTNLP